MATPGTYRLIDVPCPRCRAPAGECCRTYKGARKVNCRLSKSLPPAPGEPRPPTQAELFDFFESGPAPTAPAKEGPTDGVP